ncbi:MAG: type II secretion system F family protein [Kiritimatiellaeota bacterium]|nr:type II secretion system F family protein [Kiritimatiellota bacterium]
MPPTTFEWLSWIAPALLGLAFGGIAFTAIRAMGSGATSYADTMSESTARQFEDLFLFIPARRIAEIGWALAGTSFLVCVFPLFDLSNPISTSIGLALGLVVGMSALSLPTKLVLILKERRRLKFNLQLVDALGSMSNALRAGFSINQAFETVVQAGEKPISQEFDVMLQQMRVGMNFFDALQSLDQRVGSDDLTLVVTAIDIARRTGGNLTEIFDKISLTIRERMRIERRVRTLTAQGKLQGIIVALMPVLLGIAMTFLKPDMMIPFFKSVSGMASVGGMFLLIMIGWYFIKRIINIDV